MGGAPSTVLHGQLESYYEQYVKIDEQKMRAARSVVQDIKSKYENYVRESLPDVDVELVESGSTSEGLKVIQPDEFDIMLVVNGGGGASIESCGYPYAEGYYLISERSSQGFFQNFVRPSKKAWPMMRDEDGVLSPERSRRAFQGLTDQLFREYKKYKVSRSLKGPAVTLDVEYVYRGCSEHLKIDFVPAYRFGDAVYVAKPHPNCNNDGCPDVYKKLWRQSFYKEERIAVQQMDRDYIKCLMILKAIRIHLNAELGSLSSYVLKTLLIHMFNNPLRAQYNLDDVFIEAVKTLKERVENGALHNYFDRSMNLLAFTGRGCGHVSNYLNPIITKEKWEDLLKVKGQP